MAPTAEEVRYLWNEIDARWPDAPDPSVSTSRVFAGVRPLVRAANALPWNNTREARVVEEHGMITIVGGKYTTARALAEPAVDRVVTQLGASVAPCGTATAVLPDPPPAAPTREALLEHVDRRFARHAADVVFRRTNLWLDAGRARTEVANIAGWMGERLGWSPAVRDAEIAAVIATLDAEERILEEART